jgi:hypothetical protein
MIPKIQSLEGIVVYAEARDWTRVRFETNPNATLPRVAIKAFQESKALASESVDT